MKVFVVGNVAVDETFAIASLPRAGESIFGTAAGRDLGGKGANQAIVLARAGLDVTFVSAIGDDERGDWIRSGLREEGMEVRHVARFPGASDLSIILTDREGENTIVTTTASAGALRLEHVDAALAGASPDDWLVMQGNLDVSVTRAALESARRRDVTTAFNPSPVKPEFVDLVRFADVLVANRTEATELTGCVDTEAAALELLARGAGAVVITLGAEGALHASAGGLNRVAALRKEPVDTTGAGDAFMAAAIASAALRGLTHIDSVALDAATAAAAMTISRVGTRRAFPTRDEMKAILA
jgi:ribokinase